MSKTLNIVISILVAVVIVAIACAGVIFGFLNTGNVTLTIKQEEKIVIAEGKTSLKVKKGKDVVLGYVISDENYKETPNFICVSSDKETEYECVLDAENKKVTIKALDKDATISLSNPPSGKTTINIHVGNGVTHNAPAVNSNGTIDLNYLSTLTNGGKYLVGLYEDANFEHPVSVTQNVRLITDIYTKWDDNGPYVYFDDLTGMDIDQDIHLYSRIIDNKNYVYESKYIQLQLYASEWDPEEPDNIRFYNLGTKELKVTKLFSEDNNTNLADSIFKNKRTESEFVIYDIDITALLDAGTVLVTLI